jgi:hypothetical protein
MPKLNLSFDVSEAVMKILLPYEYLSIEIETEKGIVNIVNCSRDSHAHNVDGFDAELTVVPPALPFQIGDHNTQHNNFR